jgi:hypothetical protein
MEGKEIKGRRGGDSTIYEMLQGSGAEFEQL